MNNHPHQQGHKTARNKQLAILWLCILLVLLLIFVVIFCLSQPDEPALVSLTPSLATATPSPAAPVPIKSEEPVASVASFVFQEAPLPQYIKGFLREGWQEDYVNVLYALYAGEGSVKLNAVQTEKDWLELCRAVQSVFPQRALLYDAHYRNGTGPFSFDEKTSVLTIRYGWEQSPATVADRAEYLAKINTFRQLIIDLFDTQVSDLKNAQSTAGELYDYVCSTLQYDEDMRLDLYDAFTTHRAFCQTYSEMYQYLMWQAGYECALCGDSSYLHEWNVIFLDGKSYHVDTTWQSTAPDQPPRYYFAMSDAAAEKTGHGAAGTYTRSDPLLSGRHPVSCTDNRFDLIYRSAQ